jgi:hypothetical protein
MTSTDLFLHASSLLCLESYPHHAITAWDFNPFFLNYNHNYLSEVHMVLILNNKIKSDLFVVVDTIDQGHGVAPNDNGASYN